MSRVLTRKSKRHLPYAQRNFFRPYFSLKQNKATFAGDKTLQIVCPSLKMAGIFLEGSIKFSPVFKWQANGSIKSQMLCYLKISFFTDCHRTYLMGFSVEIYTETPKNQRMTIIIISICRTYKIQNLEISFSKNKNYWIRAFFGWENVSVSWYLGKYCLWEYILVVLILTVLA